MADVEAVKKNLKDVLASMPPEEKEKFLEALIDWLMAEYKALTPEEPSKESEEDRNKLRFNQYGPEY